MNHMYSIIFLLGDNLRIIQLIMYGVVVFFFFAEFDECALTDHGCEHDCINTLGGYECSCRIGYELHSDGKHCEGKEIMKFTLTG